MEIASDQVAERCGWLVALRTANRALFAGFFSLTLLASGAVFARPYTAEDDKTVQAVVQGQLDAFAKDDAKRAFSFAAPSIRQAFGSAPNFLAMVRRSYPVVYRPASVAFLKPDGKDDDAIQRVQMTDAAGESWLAIYSLQRQKSGVWRITGCSVVENRGRTA
jgi:Domain of unknown function (DUF4864)